MPRYTEFPSGDWDPLFERFLDAETSYVSQHWHRFIKLEPPPPDADLECASVVSRIPEQAGRARQIADEDSGLEGALWPVIASWDVGGLSAAGWTARLPRTWDLLLFATFDLRPGLFQLKHHFNRGRPIHVPCAQAAQMLIKSPGHPAYPGGHAAQGEMAVLLLEKGVGVKPDLVPAMRAAARRVADNRVVAGIHFPSDAEAGERVAEQFVPMLLASASFLQLCQLAKTELQQLGVA